MPKALRVIRLDASDSHVFAAVAQPDEWAVPGTTVFASGAFGDPGELKGKARQAFVSGFLGCVSFGYSTLVSVGEARTDELEAAVEALGQHFVRACGAPNDMVAREAAREEMTAAQDLAADLPLNTLLALAREVGENGELRERIQVVVPADKEAHARIWDVVEEGE